MVAQRYMYPDIGDDALPAFYALHDPHRLHPGWVIFYEDGTIAMSHTYTWNELSTLETDEHGMVLPTLKKKVRSCTVYPIDYEFNPDVEYGPKHVLILPEPLPLFSFTRFASSVHTSPPKPEWLSTVFGYFLGPWRCMWVFYPDYTTHVVCSPRSHPFSL
jgi:hypothetical protein